MNSGVFDKRLQESIGSDPSLWRVLFRRFPLVESALTKRLDGEGFSLDAINANFQLFATLGSQELSRVVIQERGSDSPAFWALMVRDSLSDFELASHLCASLDENERLVGTAMMANGVGTAFPVKAINVVLSFAGTETSDTVFEWIALALYKLEVPERHKYFERMLNCSRAKSRLAIALSLNGIKCERAIEQLIQLSSDKDPDVRNWATFGLREASSDSPNLCDALFDRCSDSHCETRQEAILGLALRRDIRVLAPLIDLLRSTDVSPLALQAASAIAEPSLYTYLVELRGECAEEYLPLLEEAIAACRSC